MKTSLSFPVKSLLTAASALALALDAQAATVVWGGSSGEYTTGANWVGGSVPNTNGGDTAQINAGAVNYTPGGDLPIHAGGALTITGGSWTQSGGIAWIQMAGGSINVAGGTFNQGTAGNIVRDATSSINVSSGTANLNGNYVNQASDGSLNITGGTVNIASEFKPVLTFTMTAGALNANLISFADGPGTFNLSGGSVSVNGSAFGNGIYGAGGSKSMNFTVGSSGSLFLDNITLSGFNSTNFLTNGTIQYNGTIDALQFNAVTSGAGVLVSLVPEPSTYALLLLGVGAVVLYRRRVQN